MSQNKSLEVLGKSLNKIKYELLVNIKKHSSIYAKEAKCIAHIIRCYRNYGNLILNRGEN